jgi:ElaB/YqjD/DUF883 family membrane-anchored ribosome-binding protein
LALVRQPAADHLNAKGNPMTTGEMTTGERISKKEDELDDARRGLQETMTEVDEKLERTELAFHPDHLVRTYPVSASCLAGALGFLVGSKANPVLGRGMMFALLGYVMWRALSEDGKDAGETTSSR